MTFSNINLLNKALLIMVLVFLKVKIKIAVVYCQSNLFWDCANGFVNIFSVHNDFNTANVFQIYIQFC